MTWLPIRRKRKPLYISWKINFQERAEVRKGMQHKTSQAYNNFKLKEAHVLLYSNDNSYTFDLLLQSYGVYNYSYIGNLILFFLNQYCILC